jgi:hypothetical protein
MVLCLPSGKEKAFVETTFALTKKDKKRILGIASPKKSASVTVTFRGLFLCLNAPS